MKLYPILSTNINVQKPTFKQKTFPADIWYKKLIQQGLKDEFGISCKIEDLQSIAGPEELMFIIKNLKPAHYKLGENFRAQFHLHTNASDGHMSAKEFLEQCADWANRMFKSLTEKDDLPPFSASITDHDSADNVKLAIAQISQNPDKYKNFKFVSGCEFLFDGYEAPHSAFEAIGLGFNPFDKDLQPLIAGQRIAQNKVSDIPKVKAAGGILSFAHPMLFIEKLEDENFFSFLKANGVDGIEKYYQYVTKAQSFIDERMPKLLEQLKKFKFFYTGGTDAAGKTIFYRDRIY